MVWQKRHWLVWQQALRNAVSILWRRLFWNMRMNRRCHWKRFLSLKHFRAMDWLPFEMAESLPEAIIHLLRHRQWCLRSSLNSQNSWQNRERHRCFSQRMGNWRALLPLQIPWRKTADRLSVSSRIWVSVLWCWQEIMREQPEPSVHRQVWMMSLPVFFRRARKVSSVL